VLRLVEVKVEIPEKNEVSRACVVMLQKKVKVREEGGVSLFVFGAGRRAVQTGEDDRPAGEFSNSLDKFEGVVSERERLREREREAVFVDDCYATPSSRAGKGLHAIAARSHASNDGLIARGPKPGLRYDDNV
jgi:hypothetical protein